MTRHHLNILGFIINCGWIAFFFQHQPMMWILLGMAALLFLVVLSIGVVTPRFNYFVRQTTRLKSDRVLLTFDDGPDPKYTPQILSILQKHQVKALFFVIGKKAEEHPTIVQQIIAENHLIGNHTQNHPLFFAGLGQEKVEKEIALCDNTLIAQDIHPGTYFRPPVGYTNPRIARAIKKFKKQSIGWSLRSYDTVAKDEQKLLQRLTSKVKSGDIVLLHDNLAITTATLDDFITTAKKNGIKFANAQDIKSILA